MGDPYTADPAGPKAWSDVLDRDPKVAGQIEQLVGDMFEIPGGVFFAACPEAIGPARRAAEAAGDPAGDPLRGSPAFQAAMEELEAFRERARLLEEQAIEQEFAGEPYDELDALED